MTTWSLVRSILLNFVYFFNTSSKAVWTSKYLPIRLHLFRETETSLQEILPSSRSELKFHWSRWNLNSELKDQCIALGVDNTGTTWTLRSIESISLLPSNFRNYAYGMRYYYYVFYVSSRNHYSLGRSISATFSRWFQMLPKLNLIFIL